MNKTCLLCDQNEPLSDSHIIPKSIFSKISPKNDLKILSGRMEFPKRSPKGVYDQIVCFDCEKLFSDGDGYINKFIKKEDFAHTIKDGETEGYIVKNFHLDLINYFVVSLLWRASVSTQDFYKSISLGKEYECLLGEYLKNSVAFPQQIQFIFRRYTENINSLISPNKIRICGMRFYVFQLANWEVYIKVSNMKLINELEEFADHSQQMWVFGGAYKGSMLHEESRKLAKLNRCYLN